VSLRAATCALALLGGMLHATAATAADAAQGAPAQEAHGVADAFARPGVALAWGVLRGRRDEDAVVIVRIETAAPEYAFVSAAAVDPFSNAHKAVQAPTRAQGGVELRMPRAQFADFPRTEFAFAPDAGTTRPALTVYYLGVPDTTPEFATQDALAAYLADRIVRERNAHSTAR